MTAKPTTEAVTAALRRLDGSARSAVRLLADITDDEIDELGGLPDA